MSWVRAHVWVSIAGIVDVVIAVVGGLVYARSMTEPSGCTNGPLSGLWGPDGNTPYPIEDPSRVVPVVDAVVQLTVLDDLVPVGDKRCDNGSVPSHLVRARVDKVLYIRPETDVRLAEGDTIDVTVTGSRGALSVDSDSKYGDQSAVVAMVADAVDSTSNERVPWLVDGPDRVIVNGRDREKWDQAIAEATDNG